jgi:ketosteroid isomerase-like protein
VRAWPSSGTTAHAADAATFPLAARSPARDTARAMSQENVKIVRASFEAWNAGDMDALRELYASDVVLQPADGWHEPRPYVGRDAVMQLVARVRETWDSYDAAEPISFVDAGDRVVMRYIWRGRGHGPVMNLEQTVVYTLRKSTVVHQEYFWDHSAALEAAGLSKQDAQADS